jgi:hypothetical protein
LVAEQVVTYVGVLVGEFKEKIKKEGSQGKR